MQIANETISGVLIAAPEGRIDGATSADFYASLEDLVEPSDEPVIVDFTNLHYISSAGLRVLLLIKKYLHKLDRQMAVYGLSPSIREIFEISGFSKIISVQDTRQEAIDYCINN